MSALSPSLLVLGLFRCAAGGVLAARTARWMFRQFPETFRPTASTAHTLVEQDAPHEDDGLTRRHGSTQ
jgi:hypothetical protein